MVATDRLTRLSAAGLIAVVRTDHPEWAVRVADALLAGGIQAIEFTFTIPAAAEALTETRQLYGDTVLLGAGTIRKLNQVEAAIQAGADFLVTPHLHPDILQAMLASGLPAIPGVYTPSEVAQALDLGAEVVKLFPASTGGPRHLRALRGPFPELKAIPTGGIAADDVRSWFEAGALAIGVGSELVSRTLIAECRWDEITHRAKQFAEAVRTARTEGH
jgi:2-dehydro-3-deoxyphosphogluconate aldolase/(4S)-4-hydroxy-2-oxoglutarate aldolase